ncbi:MAG: DNA-binding NtrC family response regulator, partial [Crocinitomicaceae bacterium]
MQDTRILVIDDDEAICGFCQSALARLDNVLVTTEYRGRQALRLCDSNRFDLVLTDLNMPHTNGMEILKRVKSNNPDIPVIIMTGYPTLDNSLECMRLGASDYVLKPLLFDDMLATVSRVLEEKRMQQENRLLRHQLEKKSSMGEILGASDAVNSVKDAIAALADTNVDVLIWGETGTGKELVAQNIHNNSERSRKPFVPVDCSAIPPDLFESEFFGHERGAFTGATQRSLGLMEYADGGTLFLDEIGELSLAQQAKLLRALQERRFRRVGSREEVSVDIRLLAATNRDLKEEVKARRFR